MRSTRLAASFELNSSPPNGGMEAISGHALLVTKLRFSRRPS